MLNLETIYRIQIQKSVDLLRTHPKTLYSQRVIVTKLQVLGKSLSHSSLNKAYKGATNVVENNKRLTTNTLRAIVTGLAQIVKSELNMVYDEKDHEYKLDEQDKDWCPLIIQSDPTTLSENTLKIYRDGRLPIPEKAAYISQAHKEVIMFGTRLNQFSRYFSERNEAEYKKHIIAALKRGVNFYCYLLDPNQQSSKFYFDDLARVSPKEKNSIEVIQTVIKDLKALQASFLSEGYKGKLHLYSYNHLPTYYLLALDPDTINGKMQISHYLYGVSRSNCPVFSFEKQSEPDLFRKYYNSFKELKKEARSIKD